MRSAGPCPVSCPRSSHHGDSFVPSLCLCLPVFHCIYIWVCSLLFVFDQRVEWRKIPLVRPTVNLCLRTSNCGLAYANRSERWFSAFLICDDSSKSEYFFFRKGKFAKIYLILFSSNIFVTCPELPDNFTFGG